MNNSKKTNIKKLSIWLPIICGICISANKSYSSIDHKNLKLVSYLDQISENLDEKAGIIDIIKNHKSGSYLDIGSGRDTISYIINKLSGEDLNQVNLIAADLEGNTLAEIAKNHPALFFNFNDNSDINLSLLKMDATEMHQLKDNSITAINASALLHEVNSYVPPKTPIDRFFGESIRVLKKEGFLVYRDPTLQSNPDVINSLIIKNDFAKKFITLFLPKFLDTKLTQLTDMYGNSIKPNFHYQEKVRITLYLVGKNIPTHLNYKGFFTIKLSDIDFNKDITIKAPRRLLSEIQRHYILFVKNVYPIAFVDDRLVNRDLANHTPDRAKKVVKTFSKSLGIDYSVNLGESDLKILTAERKKINDLINEGAFISNVKAKDVKSLQKLLESCGVDTQLYKISSKGVWFDAKLFAILYNRLPRDFRSNNVPIESMMWLTREGEEFYFYYTTEELVNYLHKFCSFFLKNTNKDGYFLNPAHIKYATRDIYVNLLERDMVQLNENNKKQDFVTSKTVITFQLTNSDKIIKNHQLQSQLAKQTY